MMDWRFHMVSSYEITKPNTFPLVSPHLSFSMEILMLLSEYTAQALEVSGTKFFFISHKFTIYSTMEQYANKL
jgi:hypothetical protein